jgi:hypothetical protein
MSSRVSTSLFRRSFSVMMFWAPPVASFLAVHAQPARSGIQPDPAKCHECVRPGSLKPSHARCTYIRHATSLTIAATCRHVNQTRGLRVWFHRFVPPIPATTRRVRTLRQHERVWLGIHAQPSCCRCFHPFTVLLRLLVSGFVNLQLRPVPIPAATSDPGEMYGHADRSSSRNRDCMSQSTAPALSHTRRLLFQTA